MTSEIIAAVLLVSGGFFCLVAGVGIVTLNDVYARMHAATKAGTLGLALICVAVMILATTWLQLLEALFVFLFMIMTAPVGAHLIGRAAFRTRAPMDPRTRIDPDCDQFRPGRRPAAAADRPAGTR
jgi:multicomponent Na+:H+ antiporter subunit G